MKLLTLMILVYSFSASANFPNDFECNANLRDGTNVFIEVEAPHYRRTGTRDIEVQVTSNGNTTRKNYYNVWYRTRSLNKLIFTGSDIQLEIDLWLTRGIPRFGSSYRTLIRSNQFNGGKEFRNAQCTYLGTYDRTRDPYNPRNRY